jgi:flavin reductase (DIM6/NTAB) family NADH-FMN oxidoreductase RutF
MRKTDKSPLPKKRRCEKRATRLPITKQVWEPGTMLCPVPVVMVSSAAKDGRPNICTVAWAGTVCSEPPMLSISLRSATYSHGLILGSREFVVNVPSARLIRITDYCGVVSGRDVDKFDKTGLTPGPAATVKAPVIMECPVNIECIVRQVLDLGLHTMFVAQITAVQVSEHLVTPSGRLALEKEGLAAYAHGGYYLLGKKLGHFGYSVRKRGK